MLVSFDVVSLFTNVPVDLACRVAGTHLQSDESLEDRTLLSPDQILTLLRFCLNATYLYSLPREFLPTNIWDCYGVPVSVTVADLVMEDVEERALMSFPSRPPFWKRYVDDICTALRLDQLDAFHKHLNTIESSIEFTHEVEEEGRLPFLDTEITHLRDGTLSTTVYRKRTHTDKYFDFDSHHPLSHKLAVVKTLFLRADTHCTFAPDKIQEQLRVTQSLAFNGYPHQVISRHVDHRHLDHEPEQDLPSTNVTIPYMRNISEPIRRILIPLGKRTCFKPQHTLRNVLVHVKDQTPPESRAGVVYQVSCSDCPATYIHWTDRKDNPTPTV